MKGCIFLSIAIILHLEIDAAKIIMQRGLVAAGRTVREKACKVDLTGVKQLNLFDLVKSQFPSKLIAGP